MNAVDGYDFADFRSLVDAKFEQSRCADVLDAPVPYVGEEARIWHEGRTSVLNWVIEMLPVSMAGIKVVSVAEHDRRVTELLASNNALIERARKAEGRAAAAERLMGMVP